MAGKVEVFEARGGTWTVRLRAVSGEVVGTESGFRSKAVARAAARSVVERHVQHKATAEQRSRPGLTAAQVRALAEQLAADPTIRAIFEQAQRPAGATTALAVSPVPVAEVVPAPTRIPTTFAESWVQARATDEGRAGPVSSGQVWLSEMTARQAAVLPPEPPVTAAELAAMPEHEREAHRRASWAPGGVMFEHVVAPLHRGGH